MDHLDDRKNAENFCEERCEKEPPYEPVAVVDDHLLNECVKKASPDGLEDESYCYHERAYAEQDGCYLVRLPDFRKGALEVNV